METLAVGALRRGTLCRCVETLTRARPAAGFKHFIWGMAARYQWACEYALRVDLGGRFKNVPQPAFDRGRYSEHLDQIVGDSLRDARL